MKTTLWFKPTGKVPSCLLKVGSEHGQWREREREREIERERERENRAPLANRIDVYSIRERERDVYVLILILFILDSLSILLEVTFIINVCKPTFKHMLALVNSTAWFNRK